MKDKYLHLRFVTNEGWAAVSDNVLRTLLQGSNANSRTGLLSKLFLRTGRVVSAVQLTDWCRKRKLAPSKRSF